MLNALHVDEKHSWVYMTLLYMILKKKQDPFFQAHARANLHESE